MAELEIQVKMKFTIWWKLFQLSISLPPFIFDRVFMLFKRFNFKVAKIYTIGKKGKPQILYFEELFK